jgi:DNA invertase Pin-like site-specific DNA recombinase
LRDLANEIVVEQSVDTATSAGWAFFGILAVFAQFETDVRRERKSEGIAKAELAGVYTGGNPRINQRQVLDLSREKEGPAALTRALGVSRMSVYRKLHEKGAIPRAKRPRHASVEKRHPL